MSKWLHLFPLLVLFQALITPLSLAAGLIVEGRVLDPAGKAVPGAEVRLTDNAGKIRYQMLSDMEGRYRFPILPVDITGATGFRVGIRHIRFKPVEVTDLAAGSLISAPEIRQLAPGQSFAVVAASRTLSQEIRLEPWAVTPEMAVQAALDPNRAEYYYQQALLLLGRNMTTEAVELLKLYAQTGANPAQVSRALVLVSQNDAN
jgi:hypothetical protein